MSDHQNVKTNAPGTIEALRSENARQREEIDRLKAELDETRSDLWARERQMTQISLLMLRAAEEKWLTPAGAYKVLALLMGLEKERMEEILRDAQEKITKGPDLRNTDDI